MNTSLLPLKAFKFWPMLSTHANWQWGFFSVLHLLTGIRIWAVFTWFIDVGLSWLGFENTPSACGANTLTDCPTAAAIFFWKFMLMPESMEISLSCHTSHDSGIWRTDPFSRDKPGVLRTFSTRVPTEHGLYVHYSKGCLLNILLQFCKCSKPLN